MDYRNFLARHYETNADVTISVIPARPADAEGFGLLKTDKDGRIIEFKEKPKGDALEAMRVDTTNFGLSEAESATRPYLASMGIYVFDYKKLLELLQASETAVDFGGEIIPAAIKEYNVQAYLFNSYWEDIGTIRAFLDAKLDMASPHPKLKFFDTT
jgi:glucose-1-phosphate adenylyltransferase